ncbi:MAG: FHA domain-containing protein [Eubacterium sp.]|nr:FHA domain-containing protein [Eubacterium sp.]
MREFLLNSEEQLDKRAIACLQEEGRNDALFPCSWVYYNNRIKVVCFPDGCITLREILPELTLDQSCDVAKAIVQQVGMLEDSNTLSPENVIWDQESIYLDGHYRVHMICMPAVLPEESLNSQIYVKRVYALIQEIVSSKDGGDIVSRQIMHQQESDPGDWKKLEEALGRRAPKEDEALVLKSINTPETLTFRIGHQTFRIGSSHEDADGVLSGLETISPIHAEIGWNEIYFYVRDLGSANGTYVNNHRLMPGIDVPIGEGTVLRFAEYTFSVE